MESLEAIDRLPEYLKPFVAKQDMALYTPVDHAAWRYILRISRHFFQKAAHPKYLDGLKATGIGTEEIPAISDMDKCLQRFGWRAVPVSGFIPPTVFMEFQSLGFLPIACDMRVLEHLGYTPAPDIVHEAAGHAPILVDPDYASYLRAYGAVASKAIYSKQDQEIYEAIRNLSIVKESPESTPQDISEAQERLDRASANMGRPSEAAQLARMNWWTVEYGLVGRMDDARIYGAGLLSSVGESHSCWGPDVKKIPFSLDCIEWGYDITKPQPQLFVAPDFEALKTALKDFEKTMAFRTGGVSGLQKAKNAQELTTAVLSSGLEISGKLEDFSSTGDFVKYLGPTQLSFLGRQIEGQGPAYHHHGFSSPLGKISGMGKAVSELSESEIRALGPIIRFESGIELRGTLEDVLTGKRLPTDPPQTLVARFSNCTIKRGAEVLYRPEWGTFDLACGDRVVSVYGGAADRAHYLAETGGFGQEPKAQKGNSRPETRHLEELYGRVRKQRKSGKPDPAELSKISAELDSRYPSDWLLRLEVVELLPKGQVRDKILDQLMRLSQRTPEISDLIKRGIALL